MTPLEELLEDAQDWKWYHEAHGENFVAIEWAFKIVDTLLEIGGPGMTDFDPRDRFDIPDDREPDDNIPEAVCDVQTPVQAFYFTFGQAYNLRNNYVVVYAEDRAAAVAEFMEVRQYCSEFVPNPERCWAFDYTEAGFAGQPEQYGLTEVPIDATIWMER